MIKNRCAKILCWIVLFLWLGFIFYMSAQPVYKSNSLSRNMAEKIVKIAKKFFPYMNINISGFNHYLRKIAHFFCYMVLGILVVKVLDMMGMKGRDKIIIALLLCVLYAISDEYHQLYVPGRGAQVKDIIIDSVGAIVGIGLSLLWDCLF